MKGYLLPEESIRKLRRLTQQELGTHAQTARPITRKPAQVRERRRRRDGSGSVTCGALRSLFGAPATIDAGDTYVLTFTSDGCVAEKLEDCPITMPPPMMMGEQQALEALAGRVEALEAQISELTRQ